MRSNGRKRLQCNVRGIAKSYLLTYQPTYGFTTYKRYSYLQYETWISQGQRGTPVLRSPSCGVEPVLRVMRPTHLSRYMIEIRRRPHTTFRAPPPRVSSLHVDCSSAVRRLAQPSPPATAAQVRRPYSLRPARVGRPCTAGTRAAGRPAIG